MVARGSVVVCKNLDLFRAKWIFVQTISQFEFRLYRDSAVISLRNAMSRPTPPPWVFLSFLMAT